MRSLTALTVVAFAVAAMFIMVAASTQTDAARSPVAGHVQVAMPWGMSAPDLPE